MKTYEQFLEEFAKGTIDLREAMNRPEYQVYMVKGIRGLLDNSYAEASLKATFQELVVEDTSDSQLERYPSIGDPQMPQKVGEGQLFPVLSPGSPDNVNVTNFKFGGIIEVSTEADEDDQSPAKKLRGQITALGRKHGEYKDKVFYSVVSSNPSIYDGGNFFALNHPGYTGGAARANNDNIYTNVTMSANAVATVLGIIAKWEGADPDQDLSVGAEAIVCPQTLQPTALGITRADLLPFAAGAGPLGPASTVSGGMPNAFKGKMKVVSSARLDKISTGDWYVKTDFPGLLYLKRKGLQLMMELPNAGKSFEQGLIRGRTEERFAAKVINWRWGVLVS